MPQSFFCTASVSLRIEFGWPGASGSLSGCSTSFDFVASVTFFSASKNHCTLR
jgi:hypothetical protein